MATRMQQRRGTEDQWTTANPVLNAGEIGFESDTNKFKIGDGTNNWDDLAYFADVDTLGTALSGDYLELTDVGVANGVVGLNSSSNAIIPGTSIIIEGSTANAFETTIDVTDPTADRTITFPDADGTVVLTTTLDEMAQDAVNTALVAGTGLDKTYDDGSNTITIDIDSTVTTNSGSQTLTNKTIALGSNTISGTTAEFNSALTDGDFASLAGSETLTNKTLGSSTTLGADLNASSYKITSLGTPTSDSDAATKSYVDAATAGLNVHESVQAATTADITLASDVENGDTLDGITLATGNRILVKNQTDKTENGVYVVSASGAPTRASDYNSAGEVDAGDFIFVEGGTANGKTGWVQTNVIATIGSDNIEFSQFSGAGTYSAGTGLTLTGTTFSINTGTTVDLNTAQTLTNKTVNLASNTLSGTKAEFNSALSDADFATLAGSETLTNKTISLTNNTVSGTTAEFNTALSDGDFATLAGTETLTNKTLTSPTVNTPALTLSTTTSTTEGRLAWDSTADKIIVGDGSTAREFASSTVVTNAQTASYTLVLADKDKLVEMNVASANNLTVPLNSSVAFPVGTQIHILQIGAGQTTVVATGGVTINSAIGLKFRAQWSSCTLIKRATDTWVLVGDTAS